MGEREEFLKGDRRKLLKLLGAGSIAALTGLAGFQAGRATSVQEQIPITKGSFASPADYILFQDGGVYKIKNGLTGAIEFQGASKTEALNSLLSKYPTFSGVIYDRDARQYESYLNGSLLTTLPIHKQTPQIPASYTIYKDGDVIKAKNGQTGQIEFSGTDESEVIQSAINALGTVGGRILIRRGDYYVEDLGWDKAEDFSANVIIEGEGAGTRLRGKTSSSTIFKLKTTSGNLRRVIIRNLWLRDAAIGIYGYRSHYNIIENCYFNNFSEAAIKLDYYGRVNFIMKNIFTHIPGMAILLTGENTFFNMVIANQIGEEIGENAGVAVKNENTQYNVFIGNNFFNCHGTALWLHYKCAAIGNNFAPSGSDYAITLRQYGNLVAHNILCASIEEIHFEIISPWYNQKIFGNIHLSGKRTENYGRATFSGDGSTTQFAIEHGLIGAPRTVNVTPMSSDAAGDFYVTKDSTYIYVNYLTAPPSGTDNVVLSWRAEV